MDVRSLMAGIISLVIVSAGCVTAGSAFSFPFEAILGLLMITLPLVLLCLFTLVQVENLASGVKVQGKAIQRIMDEKVSDLTRRYDETARQVMDMNSEFARRIYR